MSRIVLDTNCLIQCLPSRSKYHKIWESFLNGENELCVSMEILDEYEEILERLVNIDVAKWTINIILNSVSTLLFTPYYNFELIQADPDDNKFVDCAIIANAKYIVTEDKHFDILKSCPFPRVEVIGLDEFVERL